MGSVYIMFGMAIALVLLFILEFLFKLVFFRKQFLCYLRDDWYREKDVEYKHDYFLNITTWRVPPDVMMERIRNLKGYGRCSK